MKKYEQPKGNSSKKPNLNKDKVGQSSSNVLDVKIMDTLNLNVPHI